jgi:hypothetical protein
MVLGNPTAALISLRVERSRNIAYDQAAAESPRRVHRWPASFTGHGFGIGPGGGRLMAELVAGEAQVVAP